jgi:CBS domain-containing protein
MLKLSDIMTPEVVTVTPETTLREAVELLTEKHISGAPVVSGHQVVGVVSASDILEFAASMPERRPWTDEPNDEESERTDLPPGSYYTNLFSGDGTDVVDRFGGSANLGELDAHTVEEVMTRDAIALSPNHSVGAAAELMRGRSIHRVLVIQDGKLVGIVSTLDLVRAIAEHRLTTKTYVFDRGRDFGPSRFPV